MAMEIQTGLIDTQGARMTKNVKSGQSFKPWSHLKTYNGPPYLFKVLVDGKWKRMSGFDEEHIRNILGRKVPKKVIKIKEKN